MMELTWMVMKFLICYPNDGNADTGIEQGEIRITNTRIVRFILPETGGTGTIFFAIVGLSLVGVASVGYLYIRRKRRRGGYTY